MNGDPATRERLLEAAGRLFGDQGYKRVTVREICRAAGANVAAVNYHFGDKLGLYREVLGGAIDAMRETTRAAQAAGEGRPSEEKLRLFIEIFLTRVLGSGSGAVHRLIKHEMNEPTPALDALVDQALRPRIEYVSSVIAEIVGCAATDPRVLHCVGSVQSQALSYFPNPIAARLGFEFKGTPEEIARVADHIATFSIAGIKGLAAKA